MKKVLIAFMTLGLLTACTDVEEEPEKESIPIETPVESPTQDEAQEVIEEKPDLKTQSEANAIEHPPKPGAMLYDKTESKFKGMNYHFKGTLVKIEKLEGLFGKVTDALLVKNEQGYVMPIFPPYEVTTSEGDEIEAWGPLSGDGYASSDLGVDNVVGVAGAMNASLMSVNGEMQ
ncbi:hypothetical protein AB1K83_11455 [Sporosarcina sp. 179-K 3D1 HS]|uniref:hypothetical protein n=1 Tax=Sporosarcina sp. 179-K 3D1 HS TaxID=3232169 RepID=UPI0039A30ADD